MPQCSELSEETETVNKTACFGKEVCAAASQTSPASISVRDFHVPSQSGWLLSSSWAGHRLCESDWLFVPAVNWLLVQGVQRTSSRPSRPPECWNEQVFRIERWVDVLQHSDWRDGGAEKQDIWDAANNHRWKSVPLCGCGPGLWSIWGYCWCRVPFNTSTVYWIICWTCNQSHWRPLHPQSTGTDTCSHTRTEFNCRLMGSALTAKFQLPGYKIRKKNCPSSLSSHLSSSHLADWCCCTCANV